MSSSQRYKRISGDEKESDVPDLPGDSITIQIPSLKPFTVPYFEGQSVGELKVSISKVLSTTDKPLSPSMQRLAFNGRVLSEDDVTLHHLGIQVDNRVHCFPRPSGMGTTTSTTIPIATDSRPTGETPIVVGVVQPATRNEGRNSGGDDQQRRDNLHRRTYAYHILIQWSFRVRLFALIMLFFYGFGMISNLAYWLGDKDVPDDREIIPGEEPHELTVPIYMMDFLSNSIGIFVALLGLRSIREHSLMIAQKYVRMTMALILISIIQLFLEVYAFSDRYHKNRPSSTGTHSGGSGSSTTGSSTPSSFDPPAPPSTVSPTGTQKEWDDLAFTVSINLLIRGIFWALILNTAKKYFAAFIEVQMINGENRQVPDLDDEEDAVHGTPVVAMAV